jgi:hypothetical protein
MAFGLRNAAQALQRLKDNILMGLDYVFSSLDDDSVFSKSKEEHWTHLRMLFAIIATNGLAGPQPGEVRLRRLQSGFPGPPASPPSGTTFRSFWISLDPLTAKPCNGS